MIEVYSMKSLPLTCDNGWERPDELVKKKYLEVIRIPVLMKFSAY